MQRTLIVVAAAVVLLAVALIAFAPASLVVPIVERATLGNVAATTAEGTLWRGRATLAAGSAQLPVAWTVAPLPLAIGDARIELMPADAAAGSPRGAIRASRSGVALTGLALTFPASVLQPALQRAAKLPRSWALAGDIAAGTPTLAWTPAGWSGGLDVDWRNAQLTPAESRPVALGDLSAKLVASGNRLAGPVVNQGGDIDVRGDVAFGTSGDAAVTLVLTPRRADDAELARALAALGTADGAGWRFSWQSKPR